MNIVVREMMKTDWKEVSRIYFEGIQTGQATFETSVPSWTDWDQAHLKNCRIVAFNEGICIGWAALSPVSNRCAYGGVAEISIYVGESERGKGFGSLLLDKLIAASEAKNIWTLKAGTFPENTASIRLHEKHGFKVLGVQDRIGQLSGKWRDVVQLERRSKVVGL